MSRLSVRRLVPVFLVAMLFIACIPLVTPDGVAHAAAATHAAAVSHAGAAGGGGAPASFFGKLFGGFRFVIVIVIAIPFGSLFGGMFGWPPQY